MGRAGGVFMVSQRMLQLGTARSVIRELFEYGHQRAAEVGAENVFDFSLGNPSVPAPAASPAWRAFFLSQNAAYDYRRFLDPQFRRCGLDCSGYLGWTLCATLHSEPLNE